VLFVGGFSANQGKALVWARVGVPAVHASFFFFFIFLCGTGTSRPSTVFVDRLTVQPTDRPKTSSPVPFAPHGRSGLARSHVGRRPGVRAAVAAWTCAPSPNSLEAGPGVWGRPSRLAHACNQGMDGMGWDAPHAAGVGVRANERAAGHARPGAKRNVCLRGRRDSINSGAAATRSSPQGRIEHGHRDVFGSLSAERAWPSPAAPPQERQAVRG
jgi:hypothetical protein